MGLETAAVALVLAGALGWLVARIRRRGRRLAVLALTLALAAAGALTAIVTRTAPLAEEDVRFRPIAVESGGYVSSKTCQSCHPEEYETWHGSYHRLMTQVATPQTVLGDFDDVELEYHGHKYRLDGDGEIVWFDVEKPGVETDGEPVALRRPIVMSTGAHHMQAYWYPTGDGRALEFFPFIFLVPEQRWAARESVFLQPTVPVHVPLEPLTEMEEWQNNRRWNHSCIHCHTTNGQPRFPEVDTRVGEFGIACESCHGPGEKHVALNRDPRRRYRLHLGEEDDDTMVDPSSLPPKSASQVCGVCHGVSHPKDGPAELAAGRAFRPGDELTDSRFICQASEDGEVPADCPNVVLEQRFWSDGMLRTSGREYIGLIDSPCYQRGELSCFSCHLMHQTEDDPRPRSEWASDMLAPGMDGNAACLQCHGEYEAVDRLTAHTRHEPASTGSDCQNCHMPYTSYGLLKAMRSHEIHSPSVAASVATGRPNGCNQCHLDKTLAWSAKYLEEWYELPPPELTDVDRAVPASLVWLLSGDAGQRALMAWSFGWEPARAASGSHWMPPFLGQLLADPYDAVRTLASRSLRRHEGFEGFGYDFMGSPGKMARSARSVNEIWAGLAPPEGQVADARALIDDPEGTLPDDIFVRLFSQRDDRTVILAE